MWVEGVNSGPLKEQLVTAKSSLQPQSPMISSYKVSPGSWGSPVWLGGLANKLQGSFSLGLPTAGITGMCCQVLGLFYVAWELGRRTRVLTIAQQAFRGLNYLPRQRLFFNIFECVWVAQWGLGLFTCHQPTSIHGLSLGRPYWRKGRGKALSSSMAFHWEGPTRKRGGAKHLEEQMLDLNKKAWLPHRDM